MIVEKIQEYIEKKKRITPCHVNRASEIGHPCYRYLYFLRTAWDQAQLPTYKQQLVFEEGKLHEKATLQLLQEIGYDIIEQQRPFEIKKLKLTGHIDAKIRIKNKLFPLEIKSMSSYFFESIHTMKDFLTCKYAHIKKIPYQLQAYLMLTKRKEAILLIKNRLTGDIKEIVVTEDEKMQNEIRIKCQTINDLVEKQVAPEIHEEFDETICSMCRFAHICLPDVKRKDELKLIEDEELIALLEKREQLKPFHDEYLEVDKILSKRLEGIEKAIIGDFIVTGKWVKRREYKVPETTYWKKRILRIKKP